MEGVVFPDGEHGFFYFRLQASGFRLQASGFRLQASGFRLQASGFRLQASTANLLLTSLQVKSRN